MPDEQESYQLVVQGAYEITIGLDRMPSEISLSDQAALAIDMALDESRALKVIENNSDKERFANMYVTLKRLFDLIEASRKEHANPYYQAWQLINYASKEYSTPIQTEMYRVNEAVSKYDAERTLALMAEKQALLNESSALVLKADHLAAQGKEGQAQKALAAAIDKQTAAADTLPKFAEVIITAGYSVVIVDAQEMLKHNPSFARITAILPEINRFIAQQRKQGVKITPYLIPGIELIPKSKLRPRK